MIYIATHKVFTVPKEQGYVPLHVGAEGKEPLGYLPDNTGDNISSKNANYCELTGLYWIWKNVNDEYKGLVHYRRYFSNAFLQKNILTEKDINKVLKRYDVILPFRRTMDKSLIDDYCEISGFQKDLDKVRAIIEKNYPEYLSSYDRTMNDRKIYYFNMMIASKKLFDTYCEWLFGILFELEKEVDLTGYDDYQKRIYGFISERLLNVFFDHNHYKVFECGVVNTEGNWSLLKRIRTAAKRVILFRTQLYLK